MMKIGLVLDNAQSGGGVINLIVDGVVQHKVYLEAIREQMPEEDGIILYEADRSEMREPTKEVGDGG